MGNRLCALGEGTQPHTQLHIYSSTTGHECNALQGAFYSMTSDDVLLACLKAPSFKVEPSTLKIAAQVRAHCTETLW